MIVPQKLHVETPLAKAMFKLMQELEGRLGLTTEVDVYLAGGMAAHLYTCYRSTSDIDAEFSRSFPVPQDLVIEFEGEDGQCQVLYFDTNYNLSFALMHRDYQHDAHPVTAYNGYFKVFTLAPVDLALSKVARLSPIDKQDVTRLAAARLVSSDELQQRADEALADYIVNPVMLEHNIRDAVEVVKEAETALKADATASSLDSAPS
ncbi:DUF6036 family nucleotidyltransferase [Thalassospira lucentensis]|uniref:DUF6036 family nucleotidyltransferase n=1 Tax=Thalassospira lucentensis TaxID=168935 RepID=UPI003D2E7394